MDGDPVIVGLVLDVGDGRDPLVLRPVGFSRRRVVLGEGREGEKNLHLPSWRVLSADVPFDPA